MDGWREGGREGGGRGEGGGRREGGEERKYTHTLQVITVPTSICQSGIKSALFLTLSNIS